MVSQLELERQRRIAENERRMAELGLNQAVADMQASQDAFAAARARAAPRKRAPIERVLVREEDLRRSGRSKQDVNYNEQETFRAFKAADEALQRARRPRTYLVVKGGGGGRGGGGSGGGWHASMGCADEPAAKRCEQAAKECAEELTNTAFVKKLWPSMVKGGFWCNAPTGMTQVVQRELGIDSKCGLMAYLPEGQEVPEGATHTNAAGDGWAMVWLPRPGEYGFSGGWRSFALDMKLFPWDCVVCELLPKEQHRGGEGTRFSIILHVFRALEYETEAEKEARHATAAAEASLAEALELAPQEQARSEEPPRQQGSPAAVDAAAPQLSEDTRQEQAEEEEQGREERVQEAAGAASGGKRKRQAQLAEAGSKRPRRSSAGAAAGAAPAAAKAPAGSGRKAARASNSAAEGAAEAQPGSSRAAKKAAGGASGKERKQAAKQAATKRQAGAGKKRQGKSKKAAAPQAEQQQEEESFDVERILAVRPAEGGAGGKEYFIKWLGWEDEWNSWEPRAHLDRPLSEYQRAPGLALADLE